MEGRVGEVALEGSTGAGPGAGAGYGKGSKLWDRGLGGSVGRAGNASGVGFGFGFVAGVCVGGGAE